MKYTSLLRNFCLFAITLVLIAGCEKNKVVEPLGDVGQTLVKFIDGGTQGQPRGRAIQIELTDQPQTFFVADLRRLVPNNAELNRTMHVVIKNDPGAVSSYDNSLVPIPNSAFTVASDVTVAGDEFRVTLSPGQFAYNFNITLQNANSLDLTQSYGAGFTIQEVDADGVILHESKSFVLAFGVNNEWDGAYRLYGGFFRSDLPNYVGVSLSPIGYYEPYNLITSGANTVDATINTTTYGVTNTQIIYVQGSGYTYFTGVAPKIKVDEGTNAVTVIPGTAAAGTSVNFLQNSTELAESKYYPDGIPSAPNSAGKKTIVAHFRWSSGGVDRIAKDTFVYIGPR